MNTTPSLEPSSAFPFTSTVSDQSKPAQDHIDAPNRVRTGTRALVLGGGGSTGNAWLIGVIAGLFDAGLDVSKADLLVGTSAGSTAAAQITGASPTELFAGTLAIPPQLQSRPAGRAPGGRVAEHMERMNTIIAASEDMADMRRRMGTSALEMAAKADNAWQEGWRNTVASRLPNQHWPDRTVLITAVEAHSGEPVVFDRQSGVELVDAVAASCASGSAYRIGDHAYIDGGYRSNAENADLAAGFERVLVLAPFGGESLVPQEWGTHLATQLDELHAKGTEVEVISPDSDSRHMFGINAMDGSLRPPAAQAGYSQGTALVEQLIEFWR